MIKEKEKTIIGPDGQPMAITPGLILCVEKVKRPQKFFRLFWKLNGRDWDCEEARKRFKRKWGPGGIVEAGQKLAKLLGVGFSEVTH